VTLPLKFETGNPSEVLFLEVFACYGFLKTNVGSYLNHVSELLFLEILFLVSCIHFIAIH